MNWQHSSIKFTFEVEENDTIPFLDVKITREHNSFSTSVYCKATLRAPMSSLEEPSLVNILLCYHEQVWLEYCPLEFKPVCYRRYIDNTFLLI